MPRTDYRVFPWLKHLSGQHDQQSHAGGGIWTNVPVPGAQSGRFQKHPAHWTDVPAEGVKPGRFQKQTSQNAYYTGDPSKMTAEQFAKIAPEHIKELARKTGIYAMDAEAEKYVRELAPTLPLNLKPDYAEFRKVAGAVLDAVEYYPEAVSKAIKQTIGLDVPASELGSPFDASDRAAKAVRAVSLFQRAYNAAVKDGVVADHSSVQPSELAAAERARQVLVAKGKNATMADVVNFYGNLPPGVNVPTQRYSQDIASLTHDDKGGAFAPKSLHNLTIDQAVKTGIFGTFSSVSAYTIKDLAKAQVIGEFKRVSGLAEDHVSATLRNSPFSASFSPDLIVDPWYRDKLKSSLTQAEKEESDYAKHISDINKGRSAVALYSVPKSKVSEIKSLIADTWDNTEHKSFRLKEERVFGIVAPKAVQKAYAEIEAERDNVKDNLFHGTHHSAAIGISSTGYKVVAKSKAKTGRMLGNGVYLAPRASKSAQYLGESFSRSDGRGVLFVNKVSLGKVADFDDYKWTRDAADTIYGKAGWRLKNDEYAVRKGKAVLPTYWIDATKTREP